MHKLAPDLVPCLSRVVSRCSFPSVSPLIATFSSVSLLVPGNKALKPTIVPVNMAATTVFVARHGERIDHVDRTWRTEAENPHDAFLTETGVLQAQALGNKLASEGLTHIFASPFYRTVQTANEVAKITGINIKIEPGICEFLNPDWFSHAPKLRTVGALKKEFPLIDTTYKSTFAPVYPEKRVDVIKRAGETAQFLARTFSGSILLVAHGITCEFTVRCITGTGPRPYISYCSLQTCRRRIGDRTGYHIDGPNEPDISFMADDIKPLVKKSYR